MEEMEIDALIRDYIGVWPLFNPFNLGFQLF